MPYYIVNEFPRSGGTWVGQMLEKALKVPFPRNNYPILKPSIMHGHFMHPFGLKNMTIVWRDGRDVMVSWYYFSLINRGRFSAQRVNRVQRRLGIKHPADIVEHMPKFLEYAFENEKSPSFNWAKFVNRWHDKHGCVHVYYEDLKADPVGELCNIVKKFSGRILCSDEAIRIVEDCSFERQTGRKPGNTDIKSHKRKGVVGEWKTCFSHEAREIFAHYAGDELIKLGYEKNYEWVNTNVIQKRL
jgi:hypothetical protein